MEDSEKQPFLRTQTSIDSTAEENQNQVSPIRNIHELCMNIIAHFVLVGIYTLIGVLVLRANGYCSMATSLHRKSLLNTGLILLVTGL